VIGLSGSPPERERSEWSGGVYQLWETDDPHDARFALGADGLLADFNRAGVLTAADVHVATRAGELVGEERDDVRLALALAVRAARHGSVCVDLAALVESAGDGQELPWPRGDGGPDGWLQRVASGPLAERSVVQVSAGLLYLDRYWREEGQVRDHLLSRLQAPAPAVDEQPLRASAERLFPGEGYAEQRAAALAAARQSTTVLTGGPGTGKTTTVAGLLALLTEQAGETPLRIALTAPTGKAAARLQEAVAEAQAADQFTAEDRARLGGLTASTLHRLLGWRPGSSTRFKHHRGNRLPHDVIVVDETSMVSLTMMARLLEAVRADTRLILVGDPDQLASVEAGAVLSDLVQGLRSRAPATVAQLRTTHRFGAGIGDLAEALRQGDAERVLDLLVTGDDTVELIEPDRPGGEDAMAAVRTDLTDHAVAVHRAALAGDPTAALAALDSHRLLCAHREGAYGVEHWNRQVERWLGEATGAPVGASWGREWYPGRPVLVTANDYGLGLFNGDTGVTVQDGDDLRVVIAGAQQTTFNPSRLGDIDTLHAMTVHKSQGSQAGEVTLLLPPDDSPLLTRELFYTAVTRAQRRVRVIGTRDAVTAAVQRRALRATGLRTRLAE